MALTTDGSQIPWAFKITHLLLRNQAPCPMPPHCPLQPLSSGATLASFPPPLDPALPKSTV